MCNLTCHASQRDTTWELQLFVGTPDNELMAAYCDSGAEVFSLSDKWKTKLLHLGERPEYISSENVFAVLGSHRLRLCTPHRQESGVVAINDEVVAKGGRDSNATLRSRSSHILDLVSRVD